MKMKANTLIFAILRGIPAAALAFALALPALAAPLANGEGTLTGTVTNANTGAPISRATITLAPGSLTTSTGADGGYSISAPAGSYSVTVSAFAYSSQDAPVTITEDHTTTQNFALTPLPSSATLHGQVHDQGHGYALYAEVKVTYDGIVVADTWTSPQGGSYEVTLLGGVTYDVTVTPYLVGYTHGTATVTLNGDMRQDFQLSPDAICGAPGYGQPGCEPIPGGLVIGLARDANTNHPLAGVTVTDEDGNSTRTATIGTYIGFVLFEPTGDYILTFTKSYYQDATVNGSIGNGAKRSTFVSLHAGQLRARPARGTVNVPAGTQRTYTLHIRNTGTAPADWQLVSVNAPVPNVRNRHAGDASWQQAARVGRATSPSQASVRTPAAWTAIADYPIGIESGCAATDETSGLVYVVGGYNHTAPTAAGYAYDPQSGIWSEIANAPVAWYGQACAVVDGKLYMTDGELSNHDRSRALYIYDPASDSWSSGADEPHAPYGGPAGVVLDGKFYVIAGYVTAYDPATDSWSTLASYPSPDLQGDRSPSCGATEGKIYCAGGFYYNGSGDAVPIDYAYAYDPASNNWSPIASLPYAASGMAAGAGGTGGKFLVSLGDISTFGPFSAPTNKGAVYDVASGTWSLLPDNVVTTAGATGACGFYGFYTIGGVGNNYGITNAEVLPGADVCGPGPVPWLSFDPASGSLAKHGATTSAVTIDGTGQTPGTSAQVQIRVTGDTPYPAQIIPLTVHWTGGGG